jgi:hypothetical protein
VHKLEVYEVQRVEVVSYPATAKPLLIEAIHSVHNICTTSTDTSSACCCCYSSLLCSTTTATTTATATVTAAADVNTVAAADSGSLNDLSYIDVCSVASCSVVVNIGRSGMCYLVLYVQLQYQVLFSLYIAHLYSTALCTWVYAVSTLTAVMVVSAYRSVEAYNNSTRWHSKVVPQDRKQRSAAAIVHTRREHASS